MVKYDLGNKIYIERFNREFLIVYCVGFYHLIDLCSYLSFKYFLNLEDMSEWLKEYNAIVR